MTTPTPTTPTPNQNKDMMSKPNGTPGMKPPSLDPKASSDVAKPASEKPPEATSPAQAGAAPATTPAAPATGAAVPAAAAGDKKPRTGRKVFLVVGEVREFNNTLDAEKFLNTTPPVGEFVVIKGNMVDKKQKISLR